MYSLRRENVSMLSLQHGFNDSSYQLSHQLQYPGVAGVSVGGVGVGGVGVGGVGGGFVGPVSTGQPRVISRASLPEVVSCPSPHPPVVLAPATKADAPSALRSTPS